MNNTEIINKYYKKATKELTETIILDKDLWFKYVLGLPIQQQVVYTISILDWQVLNGGFHQYFFNSYGQFAYLTIEHLKLIKAHDFAKILEEALNQINIEKFSKDDFRSMIFNRKFYKITEFDEKLLNFLQKLDEQYDSITVNLEKRLSEYLT